MNQTLLRMPYNAVISLLRNVEDTFLKKTCKYTCSFTYIVVEASTLCMRNSLRHSQNPLQVL